MKVKKILKAFISLALVSAFSMITCATDCFAFPTKGIDVSYSQGEVDWQKVKTSGKVDFVIIRAGFGKENYAEQTDSQYRRNLAGAKSVGIPVGVYHYNYAKTVLDACNEAKFCLSLLEGNKFEYPIFLDMEDPSISDLSKDRLTNIARTFVDKVWSAGYYAGIYCNLDWAKNKLDMSKLRDVDIWIAQHNTKCEYPGLYGMWQFSGNGQIDGIKTRVDLNYAYKDYPKLIKALHRNGF